MPYPLYVEITLKNDWMLYESGDGFSARRRVAINDQRVHKISKIPNHIRTLLSQFTTASALYAVIISDNPPSPSTKTIVRQWLKQNPDFKTRNVTIIWAIVRED